MKDFLLLPVRLALILLAVTFTVALVLIWLPFAMLEWLVMPKEAAVVDFILWTAVVGTALAVVAWSPVIVLCLWSCFQWVREQLASRRSA